MIDRRGVRRRRECLSCGVRWTTEEILHRSKRQQAEWQRFSAIVEGAIRASA